MSIAGGMHLALERGRRIGCKTVQIFLKSSNQWRAKPLTEEDRILFAETRRKSGISPVLGHDSYLINLASPDRALRRKSLHALIEEMNRANYMGVPYLILHPGAHLGAGIRMGVRRAAGELRHALESVESPIALLVENTAGQGSSLGFRFEQLSAILELAGNPDRMGICLDTCHAFAAGYDMRTEEGYDQTMREFDRLIGLEKIRAFHLNDSKRDIGSRIDRHTHIGRGCIGHDAFRFLVNDARFTAIPKILETPKGTGTREDKRNLATLKRLLD